jgi:FlaA1/EpsC-like NDP-sugar epimerase
MGDKHAVRGPAFWGSPLAATILALPRGTKRIIMAAADAVAIPTALWVALILKFDRLDPALDRTFAYFAVAIVSALFFFWVFGLYRAVIRFMGPKAMVTVIAGVSLSVLVLAAFDRFVASHQIPLSAFGIYWALALPYVGGSRFLARYLFLRRSGARGTAARVAIYGAGNAGARVCSALLGGPDFEPVAFIDDKKSLQGSSINGIAVFGPDSLEELVRRRSDSAGDARGFPPPPARDSGAARAARRTRAVIAQSVRSHLRQGTFQRAVRRGRRRPARP